VICIIGGFQEIRLFPNRGNIEMPRNFFLVFEIIKETL